MGQGSLLPKRLVLAGLTIGLISSLALLWLRRDLVAWPAWTAHSYSSAVARVSGDARTPSLEMLEQVWKGSPIVPDKMTIIVPTLDRQEMLRRTMRSLLDMGSDLIDTLAIQWVAKEEPIPTWLADMESDGSDQPIRIRIEVMPDRSLNSRFSPYSWIRTHAVLSMDDDISITRADLENMMAAFKLFGGERAQRIIGPVPRHYGISDNNKYYYWLNSDKGYSIILTNVALLHRSHLALYWDERFAEMRSFVDAHRNCEDILMNFIVSDWTSLPPLLVRPRCVFAHSTPNGISSAGNHLATRSDCVDHFKELMGHMPLIPTTMVISDFLATDPDPGAHCPR